jgi:hypothetical protein
MKILSSQKDSSPLQEAFIIHVLPSSRHCYFFWESVFLVWTFVGPFFAGETDSAPIRANASTMLDRVIIERGHIRLATSVKSAKSSGDIITVTGVVLFDMIHRVASFALLATNMMHAIYGTYIIWNRARIGSICAALGGTDVHC